MTTLSDVKIVNFVSPSTTITELVVFRETCSQGQVGNRKPIPTYHYIVFMDNHQSTTNLSHRGAPAVASGQSCDHAGEIFHVRVNENTFNPFFTS